VNRPSFQFYPSDWLSNSNLRRCSFEERGIWLEVICLLHDAEKYGVSRWPLKEIAQAVGAPLAKLKALVSKGILKGADAGAKCPALVYTPRSGRRDGTPIELVGEQMGPVWYSSRMVIDEHKRVIRGESGEAPKATPKGAPKPPIGEGSGAAPNPAPDPSPFSWAQASRAAPSSSSSSSSSKEKTAPPAKPSFDPIVELTSRGVDLQTAKDWMAVRKAKRLPLTLSALNGVLAEVAKTNLSLNDALLFACRRGWGGFEYAWWVKDESSAAPAAPAAKDWE
jgi:hypothetical protein